MKSAIMLAMIGLVSIDEARGDDFPPPPSTVQLAELLDVDAKKVSAKFVAPDRTHLAYHLVWRVAYTISGEEPAILRLALYRGGRDRPDLGPTLGYKKTRLENGDVISYLPYSYVPANARPKLEFFSTLISREQDWALGIALSAAKECDKSKLPFDLRTGGRSLLPVLDAILRKAQEEQVDVQFDDEVHDEEPPEAIEPGPAAPRLVPPKVQPLPLPKPRDEKKERL